MIFDIANIIIYNTHREVADLFSNKEDIKVGARSSGFKISDKYSAWFPSSFGAKEWKNEFIDDIILEYTNPTSKGEPHIYKDTYRLVFRSDEPGKYYFIGVYKKISANKKITVYHRVADKFDSDIITMIRTRNNI